MARVSVSPDVSAWIARKSEAFPGDRDAQKGLADRVREVEALPLVLDMGGAYAIQADGELVGFDWDGPGGVEPLDEPRLINAVL
jgi:hypothetical protein